MPSHSSGDLSAAETTGKSPLTQEQIAFARVLGPCSPNSGGRSNANSRPAFYIP